MAVLQLPNTIDCLAVCQSVDCFSEHSSVIQIMFFQQVAFDFVSNLGLHKNVFGTRQFSLLNIQHDGYLSQSCRTLRYNPILERHRDNNTYLTTLKLKFVEKDVFQPQPVALVLSNTQFQHQVQGKKAFLICLFHSVSLWLALGLALESKGEIILPVCLQELSGSLSLCRIKAGWECAHRERGNMFDIRSEHTVREAGTAGYD